MHIVPMKKSKPSTRQIEEMYLGSRHFDTFAATIQHYDSYSAVSIDRQSFCCSKTEVVQRYISNNADELYERATSAVAQLNTVAIINFLRFRRRSVVLLSIFMMADELGVILTRPLFDSAKENSRHPFWRTAHRIIKNMSSDKFIACCKILERYGVLYSIGGENYVSRVRGL